MDQIDSSISQKCFFISQHVTKKRINTSNFINIYTKIHTYFICDENDFQLKNTLVNDGDIKVITNKF